MIFFIISALFIIATLAISFQIFNTLAPGKVEVLQSNVRSNMLEIITTLPPPHPPPLRGANRRFPGFFMECI